MDMYGADVFYKDGRTKNDVARKGLLGTVIREIRNGILDFPDECFDLVVSNQVFEHVVDMHTTVAEISRVLKRNGSLHALFPVLETWWEGHFGVPFLHNLKPGSRRQLAYARLWRSFGLGYNHANRSSAEWAEYVCEWVDRYTTYRSKSEVQQLLQKHFGDVQFEEKKYLCYRLARSGLPFKHALFRLADIGVGRWLLVGIYRKRGGVVITARKPN